MPKTGMMKVKVAPGPAAWGERKDLPVRTVRGSSGRFIWGWAGRV